MNSSRTWIQCLMICLDAWWFGGQILIPAIKLLIMKMMKLFLEKYHASPAGILAWQIPISQTKIWIREYNPIWIKWFFHIWTNKRINEITCQKYCRRIGKNLRRRFFFLALGIHSPQTFLFNHFASALPCFLFSFYHSLSFSLYILFYSLTHILSLHP